MEQDHYWNNCDEDGQSLSECASSVFDDDFGEIPAPEPIPEKKKRPPRKKKNKQPVPPLETTDEGIEPIENIVVPTKGSVGGNQKVVEAAVPNTVPNTANSIPPDGDESVTRPDSCVKSPPLLNSKQIDGSIDKLAPPSSVTCITLNASVKSLNPNAKAWSGAEKITKPVPHAIAKDQTSIPHINPAQPNSTWASMAGSTGKPYNSRTVTATPPVVSSKAHPQSSPRSPAQGSASNSDWTTHVVSHKRVSPQKNMNQEIPPPPTAGQFGKISWPTLEDFPPPPGAKRTEPNPTKPMGVWGRPS